MKRPTVSAIKNKDLDADGVASPNSDKIASAVHNVVPNPLTAPVTGSAHILLQYEPYLSINDKYDYLTMKRMEFIKNNQIILLNDEHHRPIFIAKGVDELRKNKNTRRVLKEFRIFEQCPEDDDEFEK
jgi:hypothetical protein